VSIVLLSLLLLSKTASAEQRWVEYVVGGQIFSVNFDSETTNWIVASNSTNPSVTWSVGGKEFTATNADFISWIKSVVNSETWIQCDIVKSHERQYAGFYQMGGCSSGGRPTVDEWILS
jgi:hypothetical protein